MPKHWNVGILLFPEAEVLDFAGPLEVLSITEANGAKPFRVRTVSQDGGPIRARNGLTVHPDDNFENAPHYDILVVPGGYGAEETQRKNPTLLSWLAQRAGEAEILASVCTGAFLLAECGLLDGRSATTHWMDTDRLAREFPAITVVRGVKYVDEGAILTSGGISAGIHMALHLVTRLLDAETASQTARRMEFDLPPAAGAPAGEPSPRYVHTNLIARDCERLIAFYKEALGCRSIGEQRDLRGDWLDRMTGVPGAHIVGEHLCLPGYDEDHPTLEIFRYDGAPDLTPHGVRTPGFAHIAFAVEDVPAALQRVLRAGGGTLGEVVHATYEDGRRADFVYATDPEGNILELQTWR